jgi:hypothetical protein
MSLKAETETQTESEKEIRQRPSFEDWCDRAIRDREDYVVLRTNVIFYGVMSNLSFCRAILIQLGKENNGMQKEDSPEFRKVQTEWWYYYRKIMTLRSFVLRYFDIPEPKWMIDLLPDRLYCGVLLSEEDFLKFVTKDGSGIIKEKLEDITDYENNLKASKLNNREIQKKTLENLLGEKSADSDNEEEA